MVALYIHRQPGQQCGGKRAGSSRRDVRAESTDVAQRDDASRMAGGIGEDLRKVQDPADVGAAEGIDGLIRVTYRDNGASWTDDGAQQFDL